MADLFDRNQGWQDIAQLVFSKGRSGRKRNRRKELLGLIGLSWMQAREGRLIYDTNKQIRALNASKVFEQAKATRQFEEHEKIVGDQIAYEKDNNYFLDQAEGAFDTKNPNFFAQYGGVQGANSSAANTLRNKEVKELADALQHEHFLRMNYKTDKAGNFDIDQLTGMPRTWNTKTITNPETGETIEKVPAVRNKYLTKEEFMLPFQNYYNTKEEQLLDPRNVSSSHHFLGRFGLGRKRNEEMATLVEEKRTALNTAFEDERFLQRPFIIPENMRTAAQIERYRDPNKNYEISFAEASDRISLMPQINDDQRSNLFKKYKTISGNVQKVSLSELKADIYAEQIDYNALLNDFNKKKEVFDVGWMQANDVSVLPTPTDGDTIKRYKHDLRIFTNSALGLDTSVDKIITALQDYENIIANPDDYTDKTVKAVKSQILDLTFSDIDNAVISNVIRESVDTYARMSRDSQMEKKTLKVGDIPITSHEQWFKEYLRATLEISRGLYDTL